MQDMPSWDWRGFPILSAFSNISSDHIEDRAAFFPDGQTPIVGLRQLAERVGVRINIDDKAPMTINAGNDLIGQICRPRGAEHDQHGRVGGGCQVAVETIKWFVIAFVEPEDMGSQQGPAAGAAQASPFGIGDNFVPALGGDLRGYFCNAPAASRFL